MSCSSALLLATAGPRGLGRDVATGADLGSGDDDDGIRAASRMILLRLSTLFWVDRCFLLDAPLLPLAPIPAAAAALLLAALARFDDGRAVATSAAVLSSNSKTRSSLVPSLGTRREPRGGMRAPPWRR